MAKLSGFIPGLLVGAAVVAAVVVGINALKPTCNDNHYIVVDPITTERLPDTCSHTSPIVWRASDGSALSIKIPDWYGHTPTTTINPYPAAACTGANCDSGPFQGSAISNGKEIWYSITFKANNKTIYGRIIIIKP
jgi:hypothetical protein